MDPMPLTPQDDVITELETPEGSDAEDIRAEIEIDLLTDLMAAHAYRPLAYTNRPSPPGSRYGIED